jgi:hypothetical protein
MNWRRSAGIAFGLAAFSVAAASQEIPNLVGTWKGTAYAVHVGLTPYRPGEANTANFSPNPIEFTYSVKEQHGNRFAGESSGGGTNETLIGALQPDNRGGIMLDNDGQYLFTMIDPNSMDVCYSHQYPMSKVVSCYRLIRSR